MNTLLLLETYPTINKQFLGYFEEKNRTIKEITEKYNSKEITGIMVRNTYIDQNTINKFPNLKYIYRVGVGTDNIDLAYCQKQNIQVKNTPGANANAVAEIALRGTLSLLRKATNKYTYKNRFGYMGHQIDTQKIGFFGFGHIAKQIHQRLVGFGVKKYLVFDPFISERIIEQYKGCKKIDSLEKMVAHVDILYILAPKTDETENIINAQLFVQAKQHLKIINIARGGIVNEKDLFIFLKKNPNAGAYLDVRESEPKYNRIIKKLMKLGNCIYTPHIGAMTNEAYENMHKFILEE